MTPGLAPHIWLEVIIIITVTTIATTSSPHIIGPAQMLLNLCLLRPAALTLRGQPDIIMHGVWGHSPLQVASWLIGAYHAVAALRHSTGVRWLAGILSLMCCTVIVNPAVTDPHGFAAVRVLVA